MNASFTTVLLAIAAAAPAWTAEDFTGTKELRLIQGDLGSPKAKTVVVTDKAKIEKLLGAIKLTEKEPSVCDHINHALFVKDGGQVTVSLRDHCFDVGKNTYVMPPEFYKLYMALVQEASAATPADKASRPGPSKEVFGFDASKVRPTDAEKGAPVARLFYVKGWKLDRALYKKYGGTVIFQQANPFEPVGAYRKFLEEMENAKVFEVFDSANRQKFWHYFVRQHPFQVPPKDIDFDKPWWMQKK